MEVPPRFELGRKGFADLGLTAWLWYHILQKTPQGLAPNDLKQTHHSRLVKCNILYSHLSTKIQAFYVFYLKVL